MVVGGKQTGFKAEFIGHKGIGHTEIEMKRNCDSLGYSTSFILLLVIYLMMFTM